MTPEERQQFLSSKGIDVPEGFDGTNAPGSAPGARGVGDRTQTLEGTIASASADKMTVALAQGDSVVVSSTAAR